jgi:hypothetical protein
VVICAFTLSRGPALELAQAGALPTKEMATTAKHVKTAANLWWLVIATV